jgi:hypothetical protein
MCHARQDPPFLEGVPSPSGASRRQMKAWPGRVRRPFGPAEVDFIGREAFLRNKRATDRAKDLGDIEGMD